MCTSPDYVVGFVDGEGSFSVNKKNNCVCISFDISNTCRSILEELKSFFGVGKIIEITRKNPNWKTAYRLYVCGLDGFLKLIDFFDKYPPKVKQNDYQRFKNAVLEREQRIKNRLSNRVDLGRLKVLFDQGLSYKKIAKILGLTEMQVNYLLSRHFQDRKRRQHCWTSAERQRVLELYKQGRITREIAKIFGVTKSAIIHLIQKNIPSDERKKILYIPYRTKRGLSKG